MNATRLFPLIVATGIALLSQKILSAPFPALQWSLAPERVLVSDVATPESNTENPGRPAVAFNGSNYLVITWRMIDSTNTIIGALSSREGEVVRTFALADVTPHYQPSWPSVAFGATNFLVTFLNEGLIRGMRVSRQGVPLDTGSGLLISSDNELSSRAKPVVAWDGERFLVVWQRYDYRSAQQQVRGAFVDDSGTVSAEFPIGNAKWQVNAAIAFGLGTYLVVWEDNRWANPPTDYSDIVGARVTRTGIVLDPDGLQICRAPGDQIEPHVAFSNTDFFIVWEDQRNAGYSRPDIYGTRITRDGLVLDNPGIPGGRLLAASEHESGVRWPRVCFDGLRFCLTWTVNGYTSDPRGDLVGIYLARVDPNLNLLDGTNSRSAGIRISTPDPVCFACRVVHPEITFEGERYLATYLFNREAGGGPLKDVRSTLLERVLDPSNPRGTLPPAILQGDGCAELVIECAPGETFVLEASSDLTAWQEVAVHHSTSTQLRFHDCANVGRGSRFYRLRQE